MMGFEEGEIQGTKGKNLSMPKIKRQQQTQPIYFVDAGTWIGKIV